jgi:DNA mismatch repair protein MutL
MTQIQILPEILSNKIAAGEVVERPASVVKELLENALDAGSSRIMVEIEQGGRSLIRVSDNGAGMSRDDALLSIERYATSKLRSDRDLFSIATLGFRGEALPSIAAVSRFSMITRDRETDTGTEIEIEGGKLKYVSEVGAPKGTLVAVKQLFFNTPARRKFLKAVGTEMSYIAEIVAAMAVVRPEVHFRLVHNGKKLRDWPATEEPFERVLDVLGADLRADLHPVAGEHRDASVCGYAALPRAARKTTRGIFVYVNGRFVRDRVVQHALISAYDQRLVKGRFPVAVVFVEVPFDQVDVNVHPTKSEVRFARQPAVHATVKRAVAQMLYEMDRPRWPSPAGETHRVAENRVPAFGFSRKPRPSAEEAEVTWFSQPQERLGKGPPGAEPGGGSPAADVVSPGQPSQAPLFSGRRFEDLRVVGQIHDTYLVCEAEGGLVLIDQHAAHERILFEALSRAAAAEKPASQKLLLPETLELGYRESHALKAVLPDLNALGLEIEPFGGNTFVVKAVPALLDEGEVKPLVVEIAESLASEEGPSEGLESALDRCRMLMACHGALRAHQRMDERQMTDLLKRLDGCENPSHCPHGRPTWIRWELAELEKKFKRIVS